MECPIGEEVGIWRSHDKKQAKFSHNKGAVAIGPWGNGTCILIAKGTDIQDPELVNGLQRKTVAMDFYAWASPEFSQKNGPRMPSQRWRISGKPYKHLKEKLYGFAWILDIHNILHHVLWK